MTAVSECFDEGSKISLIEKEIGVDLQVHGYRVLLKAITLPEKTKGGFILPETMLNGEKHSYNIGLVLKMGDQAYQPLERFGGSAYCKVGDWVIYSSYERERQIINNNLCFFVNDERIYATAKESDLIKIIPELERYK